MRGYVIDNLIEGDLKSQIREEMIQKLALEWNDINQKIEERSWRSREERDEEGDYLAEQAQEDVENEILQLIEDKKVWFTENDYENYVRYGRRSWLENGPSHIYEMSKQRYARFKRVIGGLQKKFEKEFYDEIRAKDQEIYLRKQVIEELLGELGARMMRPYEHWNEEESYREYAERDRDYDYDYDY